MHPLTKLPQPTLTSLIGTSSRTNQHSHYAATFLTGRPITRHTRLSLLSLGRTNRHSHAEAVLFTRQPPSSLGSLRSFQETHSIASSKPITWPHLFHKVFFVSCPLASMSWVAMGHRGAGMWWSVVVGVSIVCRCNRV
ncbi:hypothetical protein ACFE04_020929 [Oxalis oulophora]